MWINLSDGMFFFGSDGITVMKVIDLRDKPSTYIYRTELLQGSVRVGFVSETIEEISKHLTKGKKKSND